MFTFMAVFALIYGILNLYVFRWLRPALGWGRTASVVFALFAAVMFALGIFTHVLDRLDHPGLARFTGLMAHLWMLLVMWIVSFGIMAEIWNLLIAVIARFRPAIAVAHLSPARFVTSMGIVVAVLSIWGIVEANSLHLTTVPMVTSRLVPGAGPLRILQISDLHLTPASGRRQIDRVLRLAGESRPDLVVCTGDLFDSTNPEVEALTARLAKLEPPLGKLAVLGNHEHYVGVPRSMALLRESGFRVLNGETLKLTGESGDILLAGVDDPSGSMTSRNCRTDEDAVLPAEGPLRPFTILLKHQPAVSKAAAGRFDLQLSGHAHGGQVFPFQLYVWLFFPRFSGLYELPGGAKLYVSPGVGTWGPPIRVLARPTVTLFDIRPGHN